MSTVTEKVVPRRPLRFESLAELTADVERIISRQAHGTMQTRGNWSVGQIFQHLGKTMQFSFEGFPFQAPLFTRLVMGTFKRLAWRLLLRMAFRPGFQLPRSAAAILPDNTVTVTEGAALLMAQLRRVRLGEKMTQPSPFFGPLTHEQWIEVHLRHSAAHLSFIPDETS